MADWDKELTLFEHMLLHLTPKQYEVWKFYRDFYKMGKVYPSMVLAAQMMMYASVTGIQRHLIVLEKKGFMKHDSHGSWTINRNYLKRGAKNG